jgi:hypothetical protein
MTEDGVQGADAPAVFHVTIPLHRPARSDQ